MAKTRPRAAHSVEDYMSLPYRMHVYWDQDYWAAEFPELPGLVAGADSWDQLENKIEDAKRTWFEGMLEEGLAIPEPRDEASASGKLLLRLPKSLHAQLVRAADMDGVSLNTFIVSALSRQVGPHD